MLDYSTAFGEDFQRHILAVVVRLPGALARYRTAISDVYFSASAVAVVAKASLVYFDAYGELPTAVTLAQDARALIASEHHGAVDGIVKKLFAADISDAEGVLAKAVEFGKHAALCNAIIKSADIVNGKGKSVVDVGRNVRQAIESAMAVGEDLRDMGARYDENIEDRVNRYLNPPTESGYIPTRIRHFDMALGGGLKRGQLGMIIAPAGKGKSTTLLNIGFNAITDLSKLTVVHITMEMDADEVIRRYDDRLVGGVSFLRSQKPDQLLPRVQERIAKYATGKLFVKRYFTRQVGVSGFKAYLTMLRAHGHVVDLVIVDYADIVKAERRMGEVRHEQASIYEDLRSLAGEFNCAVWTASQINRMGAEKDTHTLTDIAESYEKAAIVDVGVTFSQTPEEARANRCRLSVEKVRGHKDHTIVECEIRRERALIRSIAWWDNSLERLDTDYEGDPGKPLFAQNADRDEDAPPAGHKRARAQYQAKFSKR